MNNYYDKDQELRFEQIMDLVAWLDLNHLKSLVGTIQNTIECMEEELNEEGE